MDERKITDVDQHQPARDAGVLRPAARSGSAQKPPVQWGRIPDASEELADLLEKVGG